MKVLLIALLVAGGSGLGAGERTAAITADAAADRCESLASLTLPAVAITSAQAIDAGAYPQANTLPAFCRVAATLKPSDHSDIKMELWMPSANWNGKFQAVGNGAFNGAIAAPAMGNALRRGYATASTDTGHTGNAASFALGHPEKVVDFGWRAVHETAVVSKRIIASYYEAAPKLSYWNGCSAGGRQAMKEAQRFPSDFDGIIAGAPGLDWTGRAAQAVRVAQASLKSEARLTPGATKLLHAAALAACDRLDGVTDGVIDDPTRCTFDPGVLQCPGATDESCVPAAQVSTARLMYSGRINPKTRREITGLEPGSELGWTEAGWSASARATGLDQFRFLVFKDPNWSVERFTFDADIVRAEESDNDTINALDPNLKAFIDHGGKLIQYHGWNDPQISPGNSTQYYKRVLEALGDPARIQAAYRLFMAPGVGHCGGGEGPSTFDMLQALEQWVERSTPPDRIVASRVTNGKVDRTRPLCPYPQVAAYKGSGSTDEASSFVCTTR
jgi:feruloyl esterase